MLEELPYTGKRKTGDLTDSQADSPECTVWSNDIQVTKYTKGLSSAGHQETKIRPQHGTVTEAGVTEVKKTLNNSAVGVWGEQNASPSREGSEQNC